MRVPEASDMEDSRLSDLPQHIENATTAPEKCHGFPVYDLGGKAGLSDLGNNRRICGYDETFGRFGVVLSREVLLNLIPSKEAFWSECGIRGNGIGIDRRGLSGVSKFNVELNGEAPVVAILLGRPLGRGIRELAKDDASGIPGNWSRQHVWPLLVLGWNPQLPSRSKFNMPLSSASLVVLYPLARPVNPTF